MGVAAGRAGGEAAPNRMCSMRSRRASRRDMVARVVLSSGESILDVVCWLSGDRL